MGREKNMQRISMSTWSLGTGHWYEKIWSLSACGNHRPSQQLSPSSASRHSLEPSATAKQELSGEKHRLSTLPSWQSWVKVQMRTVQTTNHTTNDHFGIRSKLVCSNTQIEKLETWMCWGKASSKTSCKNGTRSPITQNFCGLPRSAVGLDPYWPIHPPKNQRDTVEFLRPAGQMGATMADLVHPAGITCYCDHGRAEADMCCSG